MGVCASGTTESRFRICASAADSSEYSLPRRQVQRYRMLSP